MTISIHPAANGTPEALLGSASVSIVDGPLAGVQIVGFDIWENKNGGVFVTPPRRQYQKGKDRKSFAFVRASDPSNRGPFESLCSAIVAQFQAEQAAHSQAEGQAS
jgi:hypothetical protein